MIKKFIFTSFRVYPSYLHQYPLRYNNLHLFSTENEVQAQKQGELDAGNDRAATFYRNSVRRININDKGRGKFTQHHLLRLIKLTQNVSQTPLLFEAYYNYLGHFTVISNTVVDKMLQKVLSFENYPLQSVLQIYSNHNYLSYFPGYATTNKLLGLVQNNEESLGKVLLLFSRNPLIKWNQQIVQNVMNLLKDPAQPQKVFTTTIKLLAQKHALNILGSKITATELLKFISERIVERFQSNGAFNVKPSQYLLAFIKQIKEKETLTEEFRFQLSLLSLTFGSKENLYEHLSAIKDSQKQDQLFGYFKQAHEQFLSQAVEYFNTQELSEQFKSKLNALSSQE